METPQEKTGLQQAVEHIKKEGLPSEDKMRADLREADMNRGREYLKEYKILFDKFKKGESTEDENKRMIELQEKMQQILSQNGVEKE